MSGFQWSDMMGRFEVVHDCPLWYSHNWLLLIPPVQKPVRLFHQLINAKACTIQQDFNHGWSLHKSLPCNRCFTFPLQRASFCCKCSGFIHCLLSVIEQSKKNDMCNCFLLCTILFFHRTWRHVRNVVDFSSLLFLGNVETWYVDILLTWNKYSFVMLKRYMVGSPLHRWASMHFLGKNWCCCSWLLLFMSKIISISITSFKQLSPFSRIQFSYSSPFLRFRLETALCFFRTLLNELRNAWTLYWHCISSISPSPVFIRDSRCTGHGGWWTCWTQWWWPSSVNISAPNRNSRRSR
jgi:hypothetical protein